MAHMNQHYEGKPSWEVPTISDRILAYSDRFGVAASVSYDDAQDHTDRVAVDALWDSPDDD